MLHSTKDIINLISLRKPCVVMDKLGDSLSQRMVLPSREVTVRQRCGDHRPLGQKTLSAQQLLWKGCLYESLVHFYSNCRACEATNLPRECDLVEETFSDIYFTRSLRNLNWEHRRDFLSLFPFQDLPKVQLKNMLCRSCQIGVSAPLKWGERCRK